MKPPYVIPTLEAINAAPKNGLTVISTFAGGGGSSLGYRMAGYRVLAASEFVPAAADVYEANAAEGTLVMRDDIRELTGAQILKRVGLKPGELDVLDGSPPCAAFSVVGSKSDGWGEQRKYSGTTQRVDDLFFEYARVLGEIKPRAFVAENVAGLGMGVAQGYFKMIFRELERQGYRVKAKVLDAQWLGVPQTRRRLIFVGVRDDVRAEPVHPKPLSFRYTLSDVIPTALGQMTPSMSWQQIGECRSSKRYAANCVGSSPSMPSGKYPINVLSVSKADTVTVDPETGDDLTKVSDRLLREFSQLRLRRMSIAELRLICSFPSDYELLGGYPKRWERLGRAVPPLMMRSVAAGLARELLDA